MINTNVVLTKNNILAFIVKPSNGFTEHYVSSQPLNLYIPYTEYVSLIRDLISLDLDILRTSLSVYKSALSSGEYSSKMIKLYYYDLTLSGLEELHKSHERGFQCTRIYSLIDFDTNEVKEVGLNYTPDFVQANFTQSEIQDLIKSVYDIKNIHISSNIKEELKPNLVYYYMLIIFMGIFKYKKDFKINVKEE